MDVIHFLHQKRLQSDSQTELWQKADGYSYTSIAKSSEGINLRCNADKRSRESGYIRLWVQGKTTTSKPVLDPVGGNTPPVQKT